MLDGNWPKGGCEYCQKIENAGGSSDRMLHLSIPNMSPPELDNDPLAIEITPTILEIYFDNICNMSCVYCWDGFSSKIRQENIKFGRFEQSGIVIDNRANKVNDIDALTNKLWEWMEANGQSLKRLHVLGGEPFYQHQFDECLEFFEKNPHPNLEFNVVSNLMIATTRLTTLIDKIKNLVVTRKLKRFDLTASIDCFGIEQEYVRYGLDLTQWRKNFEYVASQKWIKLNINQTLSGLTIKTTPALLQYINALRADREIGHYFSTTIMTHECLHPEIFGSNFFDNDFRVILDNMPDSTWQQKESRKYMQGIWSQLNSKSRDQKKINQLFAEVVNSPDMRQVYASIGADPIITTPAEFTTQMSQDVTKMVQAVKVAGAHID
jgi:organic radical activating enzyme